MKKTGVVKSRLTPCSICGSKDSVIVKDGLALCEAHSRSISKKANAVRLQDSAIKV
jgi:ribosomal protein S14